MGLLDEAKKRQEEKTQDLIEQNNQEQDQLKKQLEIDRLSSLVLTLNSENESLKSRIVSSQETEKELVELRQKLLNAQDNIGQLEHDLNVEKSKTPRIEIREKEIVKLESKCKICSKIAYQNRLLALSSLTFGALGYSIVITIVSIIRNKLIMDDSQSFYNQVLACLEQVITNIDKRILVFANMTIHTILHWSIYIGSWSTVIGGTIFAIYKVASLLKNKRENLFDVYGVSFLLVDLIVVLFLGDDIKRLSGVNLIWLGIDTYAVYIFIRAVFYYIRKR